MTVAGRAIGVSIWLVVAACSSASTAPTASAPAPAPVPPWPRIAVLGASMSAGFGGTPLAEAFAAAAPGATIDDEASVFVFQDAPARGREQVDAALVTPPQLVVAIDFLFWHAYNGDGPERLTRVEQGLADLARLRDAGALVVVGDIPRITTSPLLIPASAVPSVDDLATINARIHAWGDAPGTLVVPFASWAEPLAAGGDVEISPTERVPAASLVTEDGLHPNALGVWNVLHRVDAEMERRLGTPAAALVFARP